MSDPSPTDPTATDPNPSGAGLTAPSPADPSQSAPSPADPSQTAPSPADPSPTATPVHAAPVSANPGYGAPVYAAPSYAAPGYAAPGYAAPGYAAPGGGQPTAPSGYGPGYGAPARAPRTAPGFRGVPARDYVTDGLAALALLMSLALPWNVAQGATDRIEVVLLTVLSLFALAVHYLYRAGVFPATWSGRTVALVRALITAPYVVMVAVTVLLDLVSGFARSSGITPGLGGAVVLGLTGAVLAGLPRRAELDPHAAAAFLARFRPTFLVLAIVAVVLQVAGLAAVVVTDLRGVGVWIVLQLVVRALGLAVLVGGILLAVARGRDAWRPVLLTVGVVLVLGSAVFLRNAWYSVYDVDLAVVLLPAAAALATAPVPWHTATDRRRSGVATAVAGLQSIALVSALSALLTLLAVVGGWDYLAKGPLITVFVLALFLTVAAVVGASALQQGPTASRATAWVAVGIVVVLGLVVLVVTAASDSLSVSWLNVLMALGLPALVAWALAVPGSDRTATDVFSPAGPPAPAPQPWVQQAAAPQYAAPAQPAPAPAAHGFVPAQAADPRTDLAVLARIAAEAPELRPWVAANPAAYPALLDWLASCHDPAIDAALATRPPH